MIGEDSFRTLKDVEVIPNLNYPAEPWFSTGGLAIVFKIKIKEKLYALKCFYTEANERQERLGYISSYLKQHSSPYFVDFTYLDDELWVETAHGGGGYPVVLMEWIEGKTLDNYLEGVCKRNDKIALKNLYFQFCNLAWWLQQQPISHGDLKHDNLIVTPEGKLKLIDYDGMFVPALTGRKANELGSPCYQHPERDTYFFNRELDDFSLLILQITLLALQHEPSLFAKHYNGDGILLKDTDYRNFSGSSTKTTLWQLPEVKLPLLLSQVQTNLCQLKAIDLMPLLQDVEWINWLVNGQKNDSLELDRLLIKKLIKDNKLLEWQELFIKIVSLNYSLSEKLFTKYKDKWNWREVSQNVKLPWSIELIEKYKDNWDWNCLSSNKSLSWSIELIAKYEYKWDYWRSWQRLSRNETLPWSIELLEKYNYKLDWENLSSNQSLPWSIELIEKYKDKWHWSYLSWNKELPWSIELIEKYKDNWDWERLSYHNILCSIELLDKYKDKQYLWEGLSNNTALLWSIELLEKYEDNWDWKCLSNNTALPWSIQLLEKYRDKWDWSGLSCNQSLPWSIQLLEKKDKTWNMEEGNYWLEEKSWWDWSGLSCNQGLPWSIELIEKYEDKWNWELLSKNGRLPWSIEFIEKYQYKWNFKVLNLNGVLNSNAAQIWSVKLIEKYRDKWNWSLFITNSSIYEKVFQPLLNDEFIDEIMAEIIKNTI